jgi:hypothetical protein
MHFCDCAINKNTPNVTPDSELRSLRIAVGILDQLRKRGEIGGDE